MKLLPCPFCGSQAPEPDLNDRIAAGQWYVRTVSLPPRMDGPGALIAVEIQHWCGEDGRTLIKANGRDHEAAAHSWNRRA